jgi:hypothetical protein
MDLADAVLQEQLAIGEVGAATPAELRAFMASHRVGAVLAPSDELPGDLYKIARAAGARGIRKGGVEFFRLRLSRAGE